MRRFLTATRRRSTAAVAASALVLAGTVVSGGLAATGTDTITTFAGTGVAGFSGDTGQATVAQLNNASDVAVDQAGNVYISDTNNQRVRKVAPSGVITTLAGTGVAGFSGDTGQATAAQLNMPRGIAIDAAGNVYIADAFNQRIRKVAPSGIITTFAGTGVGGFSGDTGQATAAQINNPVGVAVDSAGNVYIADNSNNRVRKVDTAGVITTFAGTGVAGFSGDTGQATAAQLNGPAGIAVDAAGNVYIGDSGNYRVRKVDTAGIITTVAGNGTTGFSGDGGQATLAQITGARGVAVDAAGNIYIGDTGNQRVRRVDATGVITTLAGTGVAGFSGDTGQAALAQLNLPRGVASDASGNVYIADAANNRIRKVAIVAPTASFTATPSSGPAPLTVAFNATASVIPGGTIATYSWSFGDGQTGAGATTSHTYAAGGSYVATLTVTTTGGGTATASQTITVTGAPAQVQASFLGARVQTQARNPRRVVVVRLDADEQVRAVIRVLRLNGTQVARVTKNFTGERQFRIGLRNNLPAGRYRVRVTFTNTAGAKLGPLTKTVRAPRV